MNPEPRLYQSRIDELKRLVDAHLDRGALDEGNATIFDDIIDAWLREEIARLDEETIHSARTSSLGATQQQAEAERVRAAVDAANSRWQQAQGDFSKRRLAASAARRARHEERIAAAAERREAARTDLERARELLVGRHIDKPATRREHVSAVPSLSTQTDG